jgi:glycosyltransferase involved in cell wall biosynthesis
LIPVIHTGVDVEHFAPLNGRKAEHPTVAFVGRISKNKGADVLFEACCLAAREIPNLRLRIIGADKDNLLASFRARASELGFDDLLEVLGFVSHADLPAQFNAAHVFALPAPFEAGPGLVNLEAMACGLPVIVAAESGAAEVVEQGRNGLLVRPGDAKSLAAALLRILSNPTFRKEMSRQARDYVLEHSERKACLRRIEAFLVACSQRRPV